MDDLGKVLITGATGFIGSHLTRRLMRDGFEVGLIKRKNSDTWRIKNLLDKIVAYDVNLQDTQKVTKVISDFRPDVIFHLATYYAVEHKLQEVSSVIGANVLGTVNLLEASKESTVKLFVNTSSCFVYKGSNNKLRENDNLDPLNLYAMTKVQTEQACSFYTEKYGLKTITFRLFSPYGSADHKRRLIPYVIKNLLIGNQLKLTTGRQKWDFVYIDDIVDAYFKLLSLSNLTQKHEIFNIGSGNAVSIREVVSRIQEIIGSDSEVDWGKIAHRKNEVWFNCADISKANEFLKWQPKINILEKGLELTVEWYEKFWNKKRRVKNGS